MRSILRKFRGVSRAAARRRAGLSLAELLVSIVIVAVIMVSLQEVVAVVLDVQQSNRARQDLLAQARQTLERMNLFIAETDAIHYPTVVDVATTMLWISERVVDTYNNQTHAYLIDGESPTRPDADTDSNGLINDNPADPPEYVIYYLAWTSAENLRLMEWRPSYATGGYTSTPLCDHVASFTCTQLASGLIELRLTVSDEGETVTLFTRCRPRLLR